MLRVETQAIGRIMLTRSSRTTSAGDTAAASTEMSARAAVASDFDKQRLSDDLARNHARGGASGAPKMRCLRAPTCCR